MSEEHILPVEMGPPVCMPAGTCPFWVHMCVEVSLHACTSHPIHGEVNPQGVMQLIQELHKALFLGRQKRRRMDVSRDLDVECGSKRWLPLLAEGLLYGKSIPYTTEPNPYNICFHSTEG